MPVNPFEGLLFWVLYGVLLGSPMILVGVFIWFSVRKTDAAKASRGFEVKQTTGRLLVPSERENDHG